MATVAYVAFVGSRQAGRRHFSGAQLARHFLPHIDVLTDILDIRGVKLQPGGFQFRVVAGDAVFVDDRAGRRFLSVVRAQGKAAGRVQDILRPISGVQVVQKTGSKESPEVKLKIDPDRANLAGITNRDVAASATAPMSGATVTTLREGNRQIPVIDECGAAI